MPDTKLPSGETLITGRQRVGPDHKPVDDFRQPGQAETPATPAGPAPEANDKRTLDPYHHDEPSESSPEDSPARPKADPVYEADEKGNLIVNKKN